LGVQRTFERLDPEIGKAVQTAIGVLRKFTRSVMEITLPPAADMLPILGAEAYAYHAKRDRRVR
jgi:hypothetical protein